MLNRKEFIYKLEEIKGQRNATTYVVEIWDSGFKKHMQERK